MFRVEATPYLYRDISIPLPASFQTLIGTIGVLQGREGRRNDDGERSGRRITYEEKEGLLTPPASRETSCERKEGVARSCMSIGHTSDSLKGFDSTTFMPVAITEAFSQTATTHEARPWRTDNLGLHTKSITFERFRSHGLSRTGREGSRQRFVTPERLLQLLRSTRLPAYLQDLEANGNRTYTAKQYGSLEAIGLSEYVDVSHLS